MAFNFYGSTTRWHTTVIVISSGSCRRVGAQWQFHLKYCFYQLQSILWSKIVVHWEQVKSMCQLPLERINKILIKFHLTYPVCRSCQPTIFSVSLSNNERSEIMRVCGPSVSSFVDAITAGGPSVTATAVRRRVGHTWFVARAPLAPTDSARRRHYDRVSMLLFLPD